MENTSTLETYGFEPDDRFDIDELQHFSKEYQKVLTRRRGRWNRIDIGRMKKSNKEKRFVRKGIPPELRARVWLKISGVEEKIQSQPGRYQSLLKQQLPENVFNTIVTDVPRTFPENSNFRTFTGQNNQGLSQSLANVLKAFAAAVPEIGYCQGMNFVAAILLLVVREEEKAFWLLEYLLTVVVPKGYYTPSMLSLKRDCEVISDLVREKIPGVANRLSTEEVSYVVICTKWFICMYCDTLPIETTLRILDCMFFEGDKIIFRVALTLFKLNSHSLQQCSNFPKLLTAIQSMVLNKQTLHCHEFMENVFKLPGSLPHRKIEKLRSKHTIHNQDCNSKSIED